jgi:hypothetical protein
MATLRKMVSDVRAMHRLLSADNMINDRVIASEIMGNTISEIKRETNLRRLWATDTLFTTIPCLEMKEVPISECCTFVDDCTIARSVHKMPRISEGIYQYIIQGVYSINALSGKATRLKEITLNRYINLLKLPVIKQEAYYMIIDDYIYVTNPFVTNIRVAAFFEDDVPAEIMYSDCGCGNTYPNEVKCMNPLDRKFVLPGYLESRVMSMTSDSLLRTYFRIKNDITDNNFDGQASNAPQNS